MAASIIHRATGVALSFGGLAIPTWWLMAIAEGQQSYDQFASAASHPVGLVVLIGITWSFFQHLLTGVRHLVTDTGAGLELNSNKRSAILSFVVSVILTAALWVYILGGRS